jgi:hydrogenase maturation factor
MEAKAKHNYMCLTIPKKVVEIKKDTIIVENPVGTRQEVKSIVDLKAGDFCLTQQNVAVQKISKKEAEEILKIIKNGG